MVTYASKLFDGIHSGKLNTWDVQWLYTCLMSDGLCIIPGSNLVSNIGVYGTHQGGSNQNLPTEDVYQYGALRHPKSIELATEYDRTFYEKNFAPGPFNIRKWIISILVEYETIKKIYRTMVRLKNFLASKI